MDSGIHRWVPLVNGLLLRNSVSTKPAASSTRPIEKAYVAAVWGNWSFIKPTICGPRTPPADQAVRMALYITGMSFSEKTSLTKDGIVPNPPP